MAYEYDGGVTETENRYSFNAEAKKRLKIMRFVKIAVWLGDRRRDNRRRRRFCLVTKKGIQEDKKVCVC